MSDAQWMVIAVFLAGIMLAWLIEILFMPRVTTKKDIERTIAELKVIYLNGKDSSAEDEEDDL